MPEPESPAPLGKTVAWFALGALAIATSYFAICEPLIQVAIERRGPTMLHEFVQNTGEAALDGYLTKGRLLLSRALLTYVALFCSVWLWVHRDRVKHGAWRFLFEPDSPINLAIFRAVLFAVILIACATIDAPTYAALPPEFQRFPSYGGRLVGLVPIDEQNVQAIVYATEVACLMAILGFFTRSATITATIGSFLTLGIPQCYGKVDHIHHLVWFALILSLSRCSDALSLDSVLRNSGHSWRHALAGPARSPVYGFPLRVIWLLFGVIYFFPGLWKLWSCGYEWGLAENLQFLLYQKWAELGEWRPVVRIDEFPILLSLSGIGTIVFELTFVALVFHRWTRICAVVAGLTFHNMTYLFMAIPFWTLQVAYTAFVPWNRILTRLGLIEDDASIPCDAIRWGQIAPVACGGLLVLSGNLFTGFAKETNAWPCSCYPTFDSRSGADRHDVEVMVHHDGATEEFPGLDVGLPPHKQRGLVIQILNETDEPVRNRKILALLSYVAKEGGEVGKFSSICVYQTKRSCVPSDVEHLPARRKLLLEANKL